MAPLLEKLKQSYVPIDVKVAFNQLLEHLNNDELDACIEAGEELLKERIPDSTRTRVHILIASCLADPDEMEEHYEKALDIWTLLNAQHGKNTRFKPFLREVRAQLDALRNVIQEERGDETELTLSAIAVAETVPITTASSSPSSDATSQATSQSSIGPIAVAESVPVCNSSISIPTPVRLSMSTIAAVEFFSPNAVLVESTPIRRPTSTSSDRSSQDSEPDSENTSERSHITRTQSTHDLPTRSSAPSNVNVVLDATTSSRLFGAIALPGQQTFRLYDHVGMSPSDILKLAWDPNRTVRGRTFVESSKTLLSRPLKRRASSTSQSA